MLRCPIQRHFRVMCTNAALCQRSFHVIFPKIRGPLSRMLPLVAQCQVVWLQACSVMAQSAKCTQVGSCTLSDKCFRWDMPLTTQFNR